MKTMRNYTPKAITVEQLANRRWKFRVVFADGRSTVSLRDWATERQARNAGQREFSR